MPRNASYLLRATALASCFLAGIALSTVPNTASAASTQDLHLVHPGHLTFGISYSDPPQDFEKRGKPDGFDVDFARAVAHEMGLKAKFINFSFEGLFPALLAHKTDAAVSGIGITPKREKAYSFVPYFIGGQRMLARKNFKTEFKSDTGLCDYKVATLLGSVEYNDLKKWSKHCPSGEDINIKVYPSFSEDLEQLAKGTVKVIDIDWPVSAYFMQKHPGEFKAVSPIISGNGPGTAPNKEGILVRKNDRSLRSALRKAVAKLEKSGKYAKLLQKWNLTPGNIKDYGKYKN